MQSISNGILAYSFGGRAAAISLVAACIAVRVWALDVDPPAWLSWSGGLWTDEGFYTLDARHFALFGHAAPGDFHDRLLSPLLSVVQQWVFTLWGAGRVQARALCAVCGLLTVCALWAALRQTGGARAAGWGALFLGLMPPFVFYNRLALQETPCALCLTLAFALWALGQANERPARWCVMAGLCLALAASVKMLALLAAPAFVLTGSRTARGAALAGLTIGLALYAALWYAPHAPELSRMMTYYRVHQMQPHSLMGVLWNVRRGCVGDRMGWLRGIVPCLWVTVPMPCILGLRGLRRPLEPTRVLLSLWLAFGVFFCLLSSYAPSRYYVLFLPALAGLAGMGMVCLTVRAQRAAACVFLLTSAFWYGQSWQARTWTLAQGSRALAQALPPGSVVAGDMAPALCLGTPLRAAPVQVGLSNCERPIERLRADYLAVTRAPVYENWWRARYPQIVQPPRRVATITLRERLVDVYAVRPVP